VTVKSCTASPANNYRPVHGSGVTRNSRVPGKNIQPFSYPAHPGPDLRGTQGARASHQQRASHQTVHILFLANDRCLRDYDLVVVRALLIIVLVRPSFYSAGPQASHQLNTALCPPHCSATGSRLLLTDAEVQIEVIKRSKDAALMCAGGRTGKSR